MRCSSSDANLHLYKIKLKKNVLLLQGPVGTFFNHFKRFCYKQGVKNVYKINFHLGELISYFDTNAYFYRGTVEAWGQFLKDVLQKHKIEQIFFLSTTRIYHQIALQIAKELDIEVYVFEQGYIRPDYLTIEQNGVNVETNLPKRPEFYLNLNNESVAIKPDTLVVNNKIKNIFYYPYYWAVFMVHLNIYGYGIIATNYLINKYHVSSFKDKKRWMSYHIYGYNKLFIKLSFSKINYNRINFQL